MTRWRRPTGERPPTCASAERSSPTSSETVAYEEKVHHLADQMIEIDLDDGMKRNYALLQDVLAKIK